jgi:hypothetical protein
MESVATFVNSLQFESSVANKTIQILEEEQVQLKQLLDGTVSMLDLEEADVPKDAIGKIAEGLQAEPTISFHLILICSIHLKMNRTPLHSGAFKKVARRGGEACEGRS